MAPSASKSAAPTTAAASPEEELERLLSDEKEFTVACYLNKALDISVFPPKDDYGYTNNSSNESSAPSEEEEYEDKLQRRMAELALQLQVQTQSCHDEIGRIGAELRAILPRCAADVGRVGVGLEGMIEDASSLLESHTRDNLVGDGTPPSATKGEEEDKKEGGEANDSSADDSNREPSHKGSSSLTMAPLETLNTLSTLHALRSNLTHTKSILTAVSSYESIMSTIPSLLSSSSANSNTGIAHPSSSANLSEAVAALTKLEAGARAMKGMPGKSDRDSSISALRSKIEILLKPQLLHALQRMETRLGPLQQCVSMYEQLGIVEVLMEEYVKSRPGNVHRLWFGFRGSMTNATAGNTGGGVSDSNRNLEGATSNIASSEELEFYTEGEETEFGISNDGDGGGLSTTQKQQQQMMDITPDPAKAFLDWLPTWYEAVLTLLAEERRRALTVFGPELAPEIIARVLNECFRPILSSFKTRLASIHPHDADDESQPHSSFTSGSLESICAAYEATLQFLSVAYDQMVEFESSTTPNNTNANDTGNGGDGSASGASSPATNIPSRTKTPVQQYMTIQAIFAAIGSPFAPYQANFASLEIKHSGLACRMVAKDIHNSVMSGTRVVTLANMQDSVERLGGLAPFMFPLAQAAVARFELLNCGYWAPNAMSTVDSLLSRHINEISIAVDTLSATISSSGEDDNILESSFDEQLVQCALEILKVAGALRKDLESFEEKTRDRMRILAGRMAANIDHDNSLMEAISNTIDGSSSGNNLDSLSLIPDSLSSVEVEAMLAKGVCSEEDDEDSKKSPSVAALLRLANAGTTDDDKEKVVLFPISVETTAKLVKSCHAFVFDICSAIPLRNLKDMSTLPVWRQDAGMLSSWSSNDDSYGTLPQSYITHVGEHMLALVQALEPFASNEDALNLANLVMDGVEEVAVQPWKDFAHSCNCVNNPDEDTDAMTSLIKGRDLVDYVLNYVDNSVYDDDEEDHEEEQDEVSKASAAFCNQWLNVVCSAVTGRLLERTMKIHHLSHKGSEHLAVDYNYLVNVFSALGVTGHPHPLLNHIGEVAKMDPAELKATIIARGDINHVSLASSAVSNTNIRIGLMRGISIN